MGIITGNSYKSKAKARREMMKRYPLSYFINESEIHFSVKENSHNKPYQPIRAVVHLSAKNTDCAVFENLMDHLNGREIFDFEIDGETRMCVLSKQIAREFTTIRFYTPVKARIIEMLVPSRNQFRIYVEVDPRDCAVLPDALKSFVSVSKKS